MYRRMLHRRYQRQRLTVLMLVLALLVGLTWLALRYHHEVYAYFMRPRAYDKQIREAARRHGLDPALLKAVVWRESRFNPNARGGHGEIGLMQIRAENGAAADYWNLIRRQPLPPRAVLYHPAHNLEIGAWYLARAMRRWREHRDQVALALSEYNAGPGGMRDWLPKNKDDEIQSRITIASTRDYVTAIINQYHEYCLHREAEE